MKNKLLVFALVCTTLGLVGCRKERTDIFEVNTQIAQKSLQGFYDYVDVDSVKMSTTLYEWYLTESAADGKSGYYRVAATGNGLDADSRISLTWEPAVMAKDQLSMTIPAKVGGKDMELLWKSGVLVIDDYTTYKSLNSVGDLMRSLHSDFANVTFIINDTTDYLTFHRDTIPYLGWEPKVVYWDQDTISAYKDYLLTVKDTIQWFNETIIKDKSKYVPDTVNFKKTPEASGKNKGLYKGLVPLSFKSKLITVDTINHGPLEIINGEIVCNRSATMENTGSFYFHKQTWTEDFYDNPASPKAQTLDSLYTVSNAKWTMSGFTNAKKFDVLVKGDKQLKVYATEAGKVVRNETKNASNDFTVLPISAYTAEDGELMLFDYKYTLKK